MAPVLAPNAGNVVLQPKILRDGQQAVQAKHGTDANPLDLVFHGGSGSTLEEVHETLDYGAVKMNIDTDTQYTFTRPIVDHVLRNYDEVLQIDGEVGKKKAYDPPCLPQAGGGGHEAARGRGLRRPAQHRNQPAAALTRSSCCSSTASTL